MRCWPARLPHSVGTLVPVTPPVTCAPQLESNVHKADTHLDILCLARSLLIRVGQGHRLELYPDLHTVTWVLLLVTRLGVTWQMASLSGVIIRLHTEGGLAGLLK